MSSIVAAGIFNAVALAGAGFLFSKLNHRGYEPQFSNLTKAKEAWYEREVARKD